MRTFFFLIGLALILFSCQEAPQKPNVVIIFLDDSGYADFSPFAKTSFETPEVQKLANEGVTYTNFHVPQGICSASRAALMSGCYPGRTKVFGAHGPNGRGLEPDFPIMSELFKEAGYNTGWFGKWHIGDQHETRPQARGFDETAGLMYSNDMWKHHPENPDYWGRFPIKYWKNGKVIIDELDHEHQKNLTKWSTNYAVDFIKKYKREPFFLYIPYSMPHVPLYVSKEFENKTGKGLYADVISELDYSVGKINQTLKDANIDDNTIVILTSDNGPWISYGNHAGKTPFREAKATSFDGGIRSSCIMKYPKKLEHNTTNNQCFFSIDLLPTLCKIANIPFPSDSVDGKDVWNLLTNDEGSANPHDYYPISTGNRLEAILSGDGKWKLHLPHAYRKLDAPENDGKAGIYKQEKIELSLFDLENDPMETANIIDLYPDIAKKMISQANEHKNQFYTD